MISDAGYQGEITSISTAAQQLEVFSRVLKTSIGSFLMSPDDWQNTSKECAVGFILLNIDNSVIPFLYRKWFAMANTRMFTAK